MSIGCTYLRLLGYAEFEDSEAHEKLCLLINNFFDVLNVRSPIGWDFKSAINAGNLEQKTTFLQEVEEVLLSLHTEIEEKRLCDTPRGMCVIGFLIDIRSIIGLARDLLVEGSVVKYILTYKFSQDHLELFFSAIRMSMRCNNNPNALQLKFVLRGLLSRAGVQPSMSANVQVLDDTELLCPTVPSQKQKEAVQLAVEEPDYSQHEEVILSRFVVGIIEYIGGFVARRLVSSLTCDDCRAAVVQSSTVEQPEDVISLIRLKDRGGLFTPSSGLKRVMTVTEQIYRR